MLTPINTNPKAIIKGIKQLHKIIQIHKIDIVHCHHRMAALYMKIYRMFYKIPMVYTLHLADIPADFIHKKMTYVGDKAIGVSTEVSNFLAEKLEIPKSKIVTICNGVDEKLLQPLTPREKQSLLQKWDIPSKDKFIFVLHSRIEEVKNHLLVVEAMNLLSEDIKEKILFVCSGLRQGEYYQKLIEKINLYQLNKYFIFTGWVKARDILGIADTLILPSINEGFGLSVVEAFFMKVPVIRTKTAGFSDQKFCTEIQIGNPLQVAGILSKYVNDKNSFLTQVEDAYEYALQNFTIKIMTKKTVDVYKNVVSNARSSLND